MVIWYCHNCVSEIVPRTRLDLGELFVTVTFKKGAKRPGGGGFLIQRFVWGRAAEMGLKISLLVSMTPWIQCKNWYKHGSYSFKIF